MKKAVLLALLTFAGLAHYANCQILLSPLSVTSKGISLILCSFVFSSVALMVLAWALQGTWSTTRSQVYSNRLATLAKREKEILAGLHMKEMKAKATSDIANYKDFLGESNHNQRKENQNV